MINGFTDAQVIGGLFGIIGGLIVLLLTLVGAFAGWIVRRLDRVEAKLDRIRVLNPTFRAFATVDEAGARRRKLNRPNILIERSPTDRANDDRRAESDTRLYDPRFCRVSRDYHRNLEHASSL